MTQDDLKDAKPADKTADDTVEKTTDDIVEKTEAEAEIVKDETVTDSTEAIEKVSEEQLTEDTTIPADAEMEAEMETVAQDQYDHLRSGQTVRLHLNVTEGKKARIQIFEGMILGVRGDSIATRTITVRKQSKGYGVEKIIPLASPVLDKIEVVKHAKVRRSKLYYVRDYKKRLRETMVVEK